MESHHTGRAGTGIVKTKIEKIHYVYRDMPQESDYGIDAEIEIKDESGCVTGRFLKAQIRSGRSYIKKETDEAFVYRSRKLRHLEYWRKCALPVLIIWVDVDPEIAYWAIVDDSAVVTGQSWTIQLPKAQRIDGSAKAPLRKLANDLANEVAVRVRNDFERIRELWLEGGRRVAVSELRALIAQPSWRFADTMTHAEAYRSLALWLCFVDFDSTTIEGCLRKAREADPNSDESVVRACVALFTEGADAALRLLDNPATQGAANLRLTLLLRTERFDDATTALSAWPLAATPNAETERMRALLALACGDLEEARCRIDAARAQKPRWTGVRETSAIIDYFVALPSSEWSASVYLFPIPVQLPTVRQDDPSLTRLRAATEAFRELVADAEDDADKQRFRTWYLAALANDPDAREKARSVAEQWLTEAALFAPMLPWVIERGLVSDREAFVSRVVSTASSLQEADLTKTDPNIVLTAIRLLLLEVKKPSEARSLLERFEHFLTTHDDDAPPYWRVRIAIEEGDLDGAAQALREIRKVSPRAKAEMILQTARAARAKDWRSVADDRYQEFVKNGDVPALADAARLHLRHGDPDFVLQVAEQLFSALPNLATLELICEAAWECGRYAECLAWLDRWRALSSTDTEALQQTRVACLQQIDPFQAVHAADDLVRAYPSPANIMRALIALLRVGDLRSLSIAARRLLALPDADAPTLLSAAHMTIVNDPDLARELWRAAMALGVDDDHVGTALSLAYELGEDRNTKTNSLITRMQQLAVERRGGIGAMSLPELLEFGSAGQQQLSEIVTQYYAAEVSIHAVAERFGWNLAEVFHLWPNENRAEESIVKHRPLLVRFGGRPSEVGGLNGRPLRMDVTAFLLAADLELLDVLEGVYAPIRVSRFLAAAIVEEQRRLGEGQPSRIAMYQRINALADSGKIGALTSMEAAQERVPTGDGELDVFLASSVANDGVFVHQLPFTNFEMRPLVLDVDVSSRVRDLAEILAVARRHAVIDSSAYEAAAIGLRQPDAEIDALPETIALSSLATYALAAGEGLAQLAANSKIFIPQRVIDEGRKSIAWARRRSDLRSWIDRLRERLHRGFERGMYTSVGQADVQIDDARQVEFESLRDLIDGAGADALWIEDRACSRMGLSVVGVSEVLHDLVERGEVSETQRSELLHKLRAGDVRYLPLLREDLVNHLGAARARKAPDTKELQAISRLYAAYALDLHRLNPHEGMPSETAVLVDASRATIGALPDIWKLHRDDHAKAGVHAWWYMTYVYMGYLAARACIERNADATMAANDLALDFAHLYLGAIQVAAGDADKSGRSTAAAYIDWLTMAFPYRQFILDPSLVALTGKHLAGVANSFRKRVADQAAEVGVIDSLLSAVFMLLPQELQQAWLAADATFGERHGIKETDRFRVDDMNVPAKPLWAAIGRWASGKQEPRRAEVRARTVTGGEAIEVEYKNEKHTISDPLFVRFAKGGAKECARFLESDPRFLDMPAEKRRNEGYRIGALRSARERVLAADALRSRGGQTFYERLRAQMDAGGRLPETAFYLPISSLADHLRWRGNAEEAAMQLLAEVGTEEALRRIITLPVYLPRTFIDAVAGDPGVVAIMNRLASEVVSPLSLMQAGALALRFAVRFPELRDTGAGLLRKVLAPEFAEHVFETFERMYVVVHGWLSFDTSGAELSPHDWLVLAMSHAGRLLDIIGAARVEKAQQFFTSVTSVPREFLSRDPDYLSDVLYPTNLSFDVTVVFGTCSLLREVASDVITAAGIGTAVQDAMKRLLDTNAAAGFFVDRALLRGRAATIYDGEVPDALLRVAGALPIQVPASGDLQATAAALLDQACAAIADPTWLVVGAILRQHAAPEEMRTRLREIAKLLADSVTQASLDDRAIVTALTTLGTQAGAVQDVDLRNEIRRIALAVAEEFGGGKRDPSKLHETGPAFFEIALAVAARHGDPSVSARELADFIDDLVRVWPSLAYSLATRLADYVWTAPADQALSLWRMLLRARENAFRVALA